MFAKVFTQIFASSIAEHYTTRHVFMDLLVLADSEGVVDMTMSAIARTTNVPLEVVQKAIAELSAPDEHSRSPDEEGRRIALIDSHRDWGWRIINYAHYRQLRDEEGRRAYHRDYMRKKRKAAGVTPSNGNVTGKPREVSSTPVKSREGLLTSVKARDAASTHAEGEEEAEAEESNTLVASDKPKPTRQEFFASLRANEAYAGIDIEREFGKMTAWCNTHQKQATQRRFVNWLNRVDKPLTAPAAVRRSKDANI
jgi:hypothetical protein